MPWGHESANIPWTFPRPRTIDNSASIKSTLPSPFSATRSRKLVELIIFLHYFRLAVNHSELLVNLDHFCSLTFENNDFSMNLNATIQIPIQSFRRKKIKKCKIDEFKELREKPIHGSVTAYWKSQLRREKRGIASYKWSQRSGTKNKKKSSQ